MNVFAEFEAGITFDAFRVTLPNDWRLVRAEQVDQARTTRTSLAVTRDGKAWVAESRYPLTSPLRIVLTVLPDDGESLATVGMQPGNFVATREGRRLEPVGDALQAEIPVSESRGSSGRAFNLQAAGKLAAAPDAANLTFPATRAFTTEFWFQTVDRDVILLSTWDGDEAGSYPMEFIVDAGGNLRCYSGQNGMHYSVLSDRPVSDGSWHHVAYVRDAEARQASLFLDGKLVDSVYLPERMQSAAYPLIIGGRASAGSRPAVGLLDELRIFAGARSAEVIAAEARIPGRNLAERPLIFVDFESQLPPSLESDRSVFVPSDLALHQAISDARAMVRNGVVEIEWRITSGEAQTVTLERSENGLVFVPIYLVASGQRDSRTSSVDRSYSFQDLEAIGSTVAFYRFTQDFKDGSELISNTIKVGLGDPEAPESFTLIGNSPNPFVQSTQVIYELTEAMHVRLSVWDLSGHLVEWLVDRTVDPGRHEVSFSANDLPSGTYFVRMESEQGVLTRKMILRK